MDEIREFFSHTHTHSMRADLWSQIYTTHNSLRTKTVGAGATTVKRTVRFFAIKDRSSCKQCRSATEKYGTSPLKKKCTRAGHESELAASALDFFDLGESRLAPQRHQATPSRGVRTLCNHRPQESLLLFMLSALVYSYGRCATDWPRILCAKCTHIGYRAAELYRHSHRQLLYMADRS